MRILIHLSDLHFGRTRDELVKKLKETIHDLSPHLVIVSGDLTQRARPSQFQDAQLFLQSLSGKKLVVPGNHDVPLWNVMDRFFRPFARYQQFITPDLQPTYEDEEISVHGINTAHGKTIAGGRLKPQALQSLIEHWREIPLKTKILVSHHPFEQLTSENPVTRKGYKSSLPSEALLSNGADLILSGHFHQGEAELSSKVLASPHRSILTVQAGTAVSNRLRGECNSFNRIEIRGHQVSVEKWTWKEANKAFLMENRKDFENTPEGWK